MLAVASKFWDCITLLSAVESACSGYQKNEDKELKNEHKIAVVQRKYLFSIL